MIKDFLENLSYRLYNENDLSDITWALCYTSPKFMNLFLSFFFPNIRISSNIEIERERAKDGSRPDFVIHNGDELYVIENKIDDHNQHFEQYDNSFNVKPEMFGYIANYVISQPKDEKTYQIRTWEDFYNYLSDSPIENEQEKSLIEGYCLYLKSVCNLIQFTKPMNIEGIYSLYQFMEILNKLCKREEKHFILRIFNQDRTFDNRYAGHIATGINFEVIFKEHDLQEWGWVGIYFNVEVPTICIGFNDEEKWGKSICDTLKKNKHKIKEGKLSSEPYYEDNAYWFEFIDGRETYEECFNKLTLNEQTEQLKLFMDEVLNLIYGLIDSDNNAKL